MYGDNEKMTHKMNKDDIVASNDFVGKIICRFYEDGVPKYVAKSLDSKDQRIFGEKSPYRRQTMGSA